mmetsp:Transcript_34785/g.109841  ORF Transcript_34785/g.109841 Transcript_34785/m.109841 type:complete len:216 (+) Transcript_34785:641-1288(+)
MMDAPRSMGAEHDDLSVETRPPTRPRPSRTVTSRPRDCRCSAAAIPLGPAPTTITFLGANGGTATLSASSIRTGLRSGPSATDGSSRNLVTSSLIKALRSFRSTFSSSSSAALICFSVVVSMSTVLRCWWRCLSTALSDTPPSPGAAPSSSAYGSGIGRSSQSMPLIRPSCSRKWNTFLTSLTCPLRTPSRHWRRVTLYLTSFSHSSSTMFRASR